MGRRGHLLGSAVALLLAGSMSACGTKGEAPPPPAAAAANPAVNAAAEQVPFAAAGPLTEQPDFARQLENFGAAKFSNPTQITNRWSPFEPGTQWSYDGQAVEEGQVVARHFVQTATDLTKPIMGVRSVVVLEQDFDNGDLKGSQLTFYAQSDNGDVWHLGEYPEEYEEGKLKAVPAWIAGIAGAQPGIVMKAAGNVGEPSFSEGFSPVVPWTDRARIGQVGVQDCVPQGCYDNMIVLDEFNREEPGASQQKYYAPGIGNTRVSFAGTDASKEVLELVKMAKLDPAALAAARTEALNLDAGGRDRSREVYGQSAPIEAPPVK